MLAVSLNKKQTRLQPLHGLNTGEGLAGVNTTALSVQEAEERDDALYDQHRWDALVE